MNHPDVAAVAARATGRAVLLLVLGMAGDTGLAAQPDPPAEPDDCAVLAAFDFTEPVGATVQLTGTMVPAGDDLPARCRITGTIAPEVGIEVWLPVETWNGKLLVTGCYGLCGRVDAAPMVDAAVRGYATATTDGGHSDSRYPDGRWAHDNTALEDDFGHRAVHVTTQLARALIEAYYGDAAAHSYFRGCSTGGRQGLVAAERYPEDFDGIIAGAPFHQELSVPYMIWADRANTGADGKPLLRRKQFELLGAAALAACDGDDGLMDGVIGDPERCAVAPQSLACAEGVTRGCLTPAQVTAAARIYAGPATSTGSRLAPFGAAPGSEHAWARGLLGRDGAPPEFRVLGQAWLRDHAFEPDPPADAVPGFDFDRDPPRLAAAAERVGFTGRLAGFRAREGRLILWHGWADETLQPAHTLAYWGQALRDNDGAAGLGGFARLYLLPGVGHCGGGPGAGDVDWLAALERWVEADEAPQRLVAVRTAGSVPLTVRQPRFPLAGEIQRRRPLFPWPDLARYSGTGDPLDPANWVRVTPAGGAAQSPPPSPSAPPL